MDTNYDPIRSFAVVEYESHVDDEKVMFIQELRPGKTREMENTDVQIWLFGEDARLISEIMDKKGLKKQFRGGEYGHKGSTMADS